MYEVELLLSWENGLIPIYTYEKYLYINISIKMTYNLKITFIKHLRREKTWFNSKKIEKNSIDS